MGRRILIVQQPKKGLFKKGKLESILKKGGFEVVGNTTISEDYKGLLRRENPDLVMFESAPLEDEEDVSVLDSSTLKNVENLMEIIGEGSGAAPVVMYGKFGCNVDEDDKTNEINYYLHWGNGNIADFILQPFDQADLLARIERLLSMPEPDIRAGEGKSLIIVSTNVADRTWLHTLLIKNGYAISLAHNSSDCIYCLERYAEKGLAPDLLIVEDLTTLLCVRREYPNVPVMIFNPNNSLDYVEMCSLAGAKGYLLKPFKPEKLLEKVQQICSLPRHTRSKEAEPPSPPPEPEKAEPLPPSPEPEDVQTPYSQKHASMTTKELIAEIERVTNTKITDAIARILVVQKMELMQAAIRKTLDENNFEVVGTVSEGWRCLELYREMKPDLVIMDTVLANDIDGVKILQILRKEDPCARVLMSGTPEESVRNECVKSGAKCFLSKPFKPEDLLEKVREAILQ